MTIKPITLDRILEEIRKEIPDWVITQFNEKILANWDVEARRAKFLVSDMRALIEKGAAGQTNAPIDRWIICTICLFKDYGWYVSVAEEKPTKTSWYVFSHG